MTIVKNIRFLLFFLNIVLCSCAKNIHLSNEFSLVWSDEFNRDGNPQASKWTYDVGDGCPDNCGYGNNELQYYTDGENKNVRVENGNLIIEAHKEKRGTKEYTSTRMISKNLGDWKYGKIEIKAKLPKGRGVWPAIWMLPTNWEYGGWPESGEIDIMEFVGYIPDTVYGSLHTKDFNGMIGTQLSKGIHCKTLQTEFHIYSIVWDEDKIDFFFDKNKYLTFTNNKTGFKAWPFDKDFHLLMNIAVGGNWGGKMGVDDNIWPQKLEIDYVRIYKKNKINNND